jgi:hypothetical protein
VIGDDLQHGIVAQTVGIVGVFISGHDLVDALPQQGQRIMMQAVVLSRIAEASGPVTSQMMALIEGSQRQQTGVAGNLATEKIGANRLMTVEGSSVVVKHFVSSDGCSERECWVLETQCSSTF